jgi:hypothetical protein
MGTSTDMNDSPLSCSDIVSVFISQFYALSAYKIRNPKHEIRNKPEIKNENINSENNVWKI